MNLNSLNPNARFNLRPNYDQPLPDNPNGTYSVVLHLKNQTSATVDQTLRDVKRTLGRIGNDWSGNNFPEILVGNDNGSMLMADYDYAIDFGRILRDNFEINNSDLDWLGTRMYQAYGEGWTGQLESQAHSCGMRFTKMSKKQVLEQMIDLAGFGWRVRWRAMNDFNFLVKKLIPAAGFIHCNSANRHTSVNVEVHGSDIFRDLKIAEIQTDMFQDFIDRGNGVGNGIEYIQLFETFYIIKHNVAISMKETMLQRYQINPNDTVYYLYDWIFEYINKFIYWLDSTCRVLTENDALNTTITRGFFEAPRAAFRALVEYIERMHINFSQRNFFLGVDIRNLNYCVDSVTAHVRSCRANHLKRVTYKTAYQRKYGDPVIFPGPQIRPPPLANYLFDPHEAPPQPPAPGEPGGFAGPAGPNELGATGSLGGPGGIGGPMGPPFPPQYFGFIDAYKDPDPNTSAPTGPASGSASIPRRPASMGLPPWGPASMGLPPMGPPPMGPPSMGPPPMGPPGGGRRRGGGRGSGSSGGGSIRGRGGGPAPFTAPASFQPPANQGSTNNQGGGPGAHGNQALAAGPVHQTPLDSFSMDEDSYRGKALHQSRVHKTGYVRKGDNVFRVQRIGDFRDANAAAFVKRAIQQEANMREDYARAIQSWEDIDIDYPRDSFHDEDDDDPYEADPMEIDSPDERRRQIDGFKAELAIHMLDVYKAELVLGQGVLANFDPHLEPLSSNDRSPTIEESARMPEFSINRGRDKPVAESLRMNRLLGLEGADEIYDY